ncbi:MAG: O-antigen ligase family protein [Solirubrobacteraceae bacterium]|nr:O-antigen ligase family protein [Solirubrobacteraceae bacterium]
MKPTSLVVGAIAAAGIFALGFSGGAYDVVTRQTGALVIWWAVGLGALAFSPAPRLPRRSGLAVTIFAVLIAMWVAAGIDSSLSRERTVVELARAVAHLGPVVLIGWVLPARYWRDVFAGLVVGAVAILLVSLGFRLSPGFLGLESSVVFENTRARLAVPLDYWNGVGSWSVLTSLLLLAVSAHVKALPVRAAALAFVPVATTVGYLTYSRSAVGAIVLGAVVLIGLSQHRWTAATHALAIGLATGICVLVVSGSPEISDATGNAGAGSVLGVVVLAGLVLAGLATATARFGLDEVRMPKRPATITFGIVAAVGLIAAVVLVQSYGQKAWDEFRQNENVTTADDTAQRFTSIRGTRIAQWESALDTYRADPLHGSGAGTFELSFNTSTDSSEFVRDAHNAFIESLSEQGWPGLVFLLGLLGSIAVAAATAAQRARNALDRGLIAGAAAAVAAFAFGTALDWFWEVTALALLVMALAGVLVAAGKDERDTAATALAQTPTRSRWPLRFGLVLVALVAVLVELPGLVGTSEIRRSGQDVATGDLSAARGHADTAIDTMPWASSPFLQRGLVDERAGEWRSARRALRLAIRRDPYDWRLPLVLARIEAKSGRPEQALEAFRQGKALRRGGSFFR